MLCDYGCGKEATHQFKNGKWCCESNISKCPGIIAIKKQHPYEKFKLTENKNNELCAYGCGQEGKCLSKNGKWCCEDYFSKCPKMKKQMSENFSGENAPNFGNKQTKESRQKMSKSYSQRQGPKLVKTDHLCDYGCGQKGHYLFKNGKYCCSKNGQSCEGIKKQKRHIKLKLIENKNNELCAHGCGNVGKYLAKNGNWCCSSNISKCPAIKNKFSIAASKKTGDKNPFYNKQHTVESRKKIGEKSKGRVPWNKDKTDVYNNETLENIRLGALLTISKIKKKYPTFFKIEEMRYNPNKPGEKEIQVHCKNHNCVNSKEKDGWFTPITRDQFYDRRKALEDPNGNGGSYFYCCEDCKEECPLYRAKIATLISQDKIRAGLIEDPWCTYGEGLIWRKVVLKMDNGLCVWCGAPATIVHHIFPRKTHPESAVDPDNGLSCCEECHNKKGHRDRWCTFGYLANLVCERIYRIDKKAKKLKI